VGLLIRSAEESGSLTCQQRAAATRAADVVVRYEQMGALDHVHLSRSCVARERTLGGMDRQVIGGNRLTHYVVSAIATGGGHDASHPPP
jgi:hypothetical protein